MFQNSNHFITLHDMWVSQLGRAQWHISCCIWWHWSSFSGIWLVESSSEECKVVSPIRPVLWGDDWEAGHCWDCWLDCLSVVSPAWPCQDNWTLHMAAKGSQREFSKEHEVKCHHFLKLTHSPNPFLCNTFQCATKSEHKGSGRFKIDEESSTLWSSRDRVYVASFELG